ncbi:MAG: hypothetical protein H7245_01770 [Candidatus Saccharibacteria bacterium]|nr:hypothetical protein [Pseudorhodobacter sp.]
MYCVEGDGDSVCPWCKRTATYTASSDGAGFDINQGRG